MFRQRNFRLLWIGETISGAGTSMATVGVPLAAVTVLRASTFAVAALTAAAYLPWLVIGLPAGAWVDRLPVRPLMIGCDVLSALLFASLPVAAWLGWLRTGQLIVVALLAGTANVFFATAYQVCLPSLVTATELMAGNARLQGGASVAAISGRGLAGVAVQAAGAVAPAHDQHDHGLSGLLSPLTERGFRLACYLTGSVLIAGGIVVGNVIAASFRQQYCPPAMLERVTASMRFAAFGMVPVGAVLAGTLGTALGVRNALWIVQAIFAASSLFLLISSIRTTRNVLHTRKSLRCQPESSTCMSVGPTG